MRLRVKAQEKTFPGGCRNQGGFLEEVVLGRSWKNREGARGHRGCWCFHNPTLPAFSQQPSQDSGHFHHSASV